MIHCSGIAMMPYESLQCYYLDSGIVCARTVTLQGRWKLSRGGAAVGRDARGRAAADSIFTIISVNFCSII